MHECKVLKKEKRKKKLRNPSVWVGRHAMAYIIGMLSICTTLKIDSRQFFFCIIKVGDKNTRKQNTQLVHN